MELTDWLAKSPLIAILRGVRPDEILAIADALDAAGLAIIEVPLNSPDPFESIRLLTQKFGDRLLLGAGTVRTAEEVERVRAAGGRLIVTPHAAAEVVRAAKLHGMLACPGFATPTEAFAMIDAGANGLKLFPAEGASPTVLRAIRAVLPPDIPVMPVGGIEPANMGAWREAGAAGFGIGGAIYRRGDSPATVAAKAAALVAALV